MQRDPRLPRYLWFVNGVSSPPADEKWVIGWCGRNDCSSWIGGCILEACPIPDVGALLARFLPGLGNNAEVGRVMRIRGIRKPTTSRA